MHELDQMTPNQRLNAFMTGIASNGSNACNAGHSIYVRRCMWDDPSREKKLTGE